MHMRYCFVFEYKAIKSNAIKGKKYTNNILKYKLKPIEK